MEPQISFIPKKPITEKARPARPVGIFLVASVVLALFSLGAYGGFAFYNSELARKIERTQKEVREETEHIDPDGIVVRARAIRERIETLDRILEDHIAVTPVFEFLKAHTVQSVAFGDFGFTVSDPKNEGSASARVGQLAGVAAAPVAKKHVVVLTGETVGYGPLAFQRDVFRAQKDVVESVVMTDMTLGEKGGVAFTMEVVLRPSYARYLSLFPSVPGAESGVEIESTSVLPEIDTLPTEKGGDKEEFII